MFSHRLAWPQPENRLTVLLREKRRRGARLVDLTLSNPTRAGIEYPAAALAGALADEANAVYDPDPRGLPVARRAVAAWCAARGRPADPDHIVLTASTSEAYAFLFRALADPGDRILVPRPSYPLFDYLAALDGVVPVPYPACFDGAASLDLDALDRALPARRSRRASGDPSDPPGTPRAIVLVSPNNPTGAALRPGERAALDALAAERGVAIVADEVFVDYPFAAGAVLPSMAGPRPAGEPRALTFTLGGLSKACGLPQMKLGWIVVDGPADLRDEALDRLEIVADSYLSVGVPVQRAAARLLALGDSIRERIRGRVAANRAALIDAIPADSPCRLLPGDGGWSAVLQIPAVVAEEDVVLGLLERDDVLVHPGYFFDFPREAYLVLSLLPEEGVFREGVHRILARCPA